MSDMAHTLEQPGPRSHSQSTNQPEPRAAAGPPRMTIKRKEIGGEHYYLVGWPARRGNGMEHVLREPFSLCIVTEGDMALKPPSHPLLLHEKLLF